MKKIYIDDEGRIFEGLEAEVVEQVEDNLANAGYFEAVERETKVGNKMTNIKLQLGDKFKESKGRRGELKTRINRFSRGAIASIKNVDVNMPTIKTAVIGGAVVGALELVSTKDIKTTAINTAKNIAGSSTAGILTNAILNGTAAAINEKNLEILEERV